MTDIVERLRGKFLVINAGRIDPLLDEAADNIERLRAEVTKYKNLWIWDNEEGDPRDA